MKIRGGVDLGGTKIQTVVVNSKNEVLAEVRMPTPTKGGPQDVVDAIAGALHDAADAAGKQTDDLASVGVGAPGAIDEAQGTVAQPPNLPGWDGPYPLAGELERRIGARVSLGNDVSVSTAAEFQLGAGREFDSILGVFWGTGVGGGIVLGGREWTGRGAAGELGHVVIKQGGDKCPCGRRGCLEAYAGRRAMEARARHLHDKGEKTALFEIMKKRGRDRLTSGIWDRALKRDDKLAHAIVDRAVKALGAGVASAVNLLDVEAVIIGGGLGTRLGEPYAQKIAAAMQPHLFVNERPPAIKVAELGDLGGAIGAAQLST